MLHEYFFQIWSLSVRWKKSIIRKLCNLGRKLRIIKIIDMKIDTSYIDLEYRIIWLWNWIVNLLSFLIHMLTLRVMCKKWLHVTWLATIIFRSEFLTRQIIPRYEANMMRNGTNQAKNNKVTTYDRSCQEDEKLSNAHPRKYG